MTFFDEIFDDVHVFLFGVYLSPEENQHPIWGLTVFKGKVTSVTGREQKTRFMKEH